MHRYLGEVRGRGIEGEGWESVNMLRTQHQIEKKLRTRMLLPAAYISSACSISRGRRAFEGTERK